MNQMNQSVIDIAISLNRFDKSIRKFVSYAKAWTCFGKTRQVCNEQNCGINNWNLQNRYQSLIQFYFLNLTSQNRKRGMHKYSLHKLEILRIIRQDWRRVKLRMIRSELRFLAILRRCCDPYTMCSEGEERCEGFFLTHADLSWCNNTSILIIHRLRL